MIYLASASPRRKSLLEEKGYEIKIVKSQYEEDNNDKSTAYNLVMEQALGKAMMAICDKTAEDVVIGADTIVVLDGKVLGKPKTREEANEMLQSLSNKTHEVVTGVAIVKDDTKDVFFVSTKITFKELTEKMIEDYIATGSPMDKAGAYGVQDLDDKWLGAVDGSKSNVIGLPIEAVSERLFLLGIEPKEV